MPLSTAPLRFNPPPNWPLPATGWSPPPGWRPDPAWGPAPYGWPMWVPAAGDRHGHRRLSGTLVAAVLAMLLCGVVIGLNSTVRPLAGADPRPAAASAGPSRSATAGTRPADASPRPGPAPTGAAGRARSAGRPAAGKTTGGRSAAGKSVARKRTAGAFRPVRDGSFEFVVRRVAVRDSIGAGLLATEAEGRFVVVSVDVRNIGRTTRTFVGAAQRLYDSGGREFTVTTAVFRLPGAGRAVATRIEPGHLVSAVPLVFDVPADARLDRLELHDFFLSGGVDVPLGRR